KHFISLLLDLILLTGLENNWYSEGGLPIIAIVVSSKRFVHPLKEISVVRMNCHPNEELGAL
ncbi:UNVERIFIED_CONTAM: hypothetical protein NY603_23655, partial [Bacteroidetes bacterium 56_B9]